MISQAKAIDEIEKCTNEYSQIENLSMDDLSDYVYRVILSEKEIYDKNLVDNQSEMALVYRNNGIDVGQIEDKANDSSSVSTRSITINGSCVWAVTKALGKIGLIAAGGYAVGKLTAIAETLGSLKDAAYLIALAIKDRNLKSYLQGVGISNSDKIDIIIGAATQIALSVTGVGEVKKNCWN
ncbi:hypothetical protein ACKRLN_07795 [Anaerococcus sp. DFU013_CI05]|uniref:hypothetical protein n=1 Tax=Anaerococcus sp. AH8042_DFU013_CI05 TaxID=3385202 RepID=UPI003A521F55